MYNQQPKKRKLKMILNMRKSCITVSCTIISRVTFSLASITWPWTSVDDEEDFIDKYL